MTSNNYNHDLRVEARIAFSNRRSALLKDWLLADAAKTGQWAQDTAERLRLCNDAEIELLGGSY